MALLDLSTLIIPDIPQGSWAKYKYFIITEQPFMNWQLDDYVYIPDMNKTFVSNLCILTCETNVLKLYNDNGIMTIIPQHDTQDYDEPIFTRNIYNYELKNWECLENFFWNYAQAKSMLDYIKEKCGYVRGFNNKEFNLIKPQGHFNDINKNLKKHGGNENGK